MLLAVRPVVAAEVRFLPSEELFAEPERGFAVPVDLLALPATLAALRDDGVSLVRSTVRLDSYRETELPASLFVALDAAADRLRGAGLKLVLRFAYNDAEGAADATKAHILEHIAQVGPWVARQADLIVALEAGFIGAWGEWHHSTHGLDTPEARREILQALLREVPASVPVLVRAPRFKEELGPDVALRARVGHHDDCFLADETDVGTFAPGDPELWRQRLAEDGLLVPVGGETCQKAPPRTECPDAEAALARYHVVYLNRAYHPDVLAAWAASGCRARIERRLGHRFVLVRGRFERRLQPGGWLRLELTVRNEGYSRLHRARPLRLVLRVGRRRWVAPVRDVDPRAWAPGAETTFRARLRLPSGLPKGRASLALWLPDPSPALQDRAGYALRFANAGMWDATAGETVIARALPIARGAPEAGSGRADFRLCATPR